jgi:hypothetical protein
MPVHIRNFYYKQLVEAKKSEKKRSEDASTNAKQSKVKVRR